MKLIKTSMLVLAVIMQSCASIVKGSNQTVFVSSTPSEASILVKDNKGNNIVSTVSPASLNLQRGTGYFSSASYSIEVSKKGYKTQYITLTGGLNGWYLAGNLLIGGLIGWLIIDPISGAMWTLSPEFANITMAKDDEKAMNKDETNVYIALIEDVPESVKSKMVKIK